MSKQLGFELGDDALTQQPAPDPVTAFALRHRSPDVVIRGYLVRDLDGRGGTEVTPPDEGRRVQTFALRTTAIAWLHRDADTWEVFHARERGVSA